jgi:hypothetical protein
MEASRTQVCSQYLTLLQHLVRIPEVQSYYTHLHLSLQFIETVTISSVSYLISLKLKTCLDASLRDIIL